MQYNEMRVDMKILHRETGLTAIISDVSKGKFQYVDQYGRVKTLERYEATEWEKADG